VLTPWSRAVFDYAPTMAVIYFGGDEALTVQEDPTTIETKIREARDDRTSFVKLTLEGDGGPTWVNADRILRFAEQ
jgi:hypothetical protein